MSQFEQTAKLMECLVEQMKLPYRVEHNVRVKHG